MADQKIVYFQSEKEKRARAEKPESTYRRIVASLSELDDLINETKYPAGEFLMIGVLSAIITAIAVVKTPTTGGQPHRPDHEKNNS